MATIPGCRGRGWIMSAVAASPQAFALAASLCGVPCDAADLQHQFQDGGTFGFAEMLRAAKALRLKARVGVWAARP